MGNLIFVIVQVPPLVLQPAIWFVFYIIHHAFLKLYIGVVPYSLLRFLSTFGKARPHTGQLRN